VTPAQFDEQMESWNMAMVKLLDQVIDLADKKEQLLDQFLSEWAGNLDMRMIGYWRDNVAGFRPQGPPPSEEII